jgi:predicted Rossmann fold nucleotide-binding protein DprA/Smf involved in DNA uptake
MSGTRTPVAVVAPASLGGAPPLRNVREVIRDEHVMRPRILSAVADGPLTVPQIAEAIGYPVREVMFWVMGMRKYGQLIEVTPADDDGYFTYRSIATEETHS